MNSRQRLLLVGSNGMLAHKVKKLAGKSYELTCVDLPAFDLTDASQVVETVTRLKPHVIVNCAAYTNVDGCETEEELATRINGTALGHLVVATKEVDAALVQISTDYVFPGTGSTPLTEKDPTGPQSAYGRSKLAGEEAILQSNLDKYFILRTSWLYGSGGKNFVETIIRLAKERETLNIVADQVGSPTYTGDLAAAIFALLSLGTSHSLFDADLYGLYHFSNAGQCSWYDFAVEIIQQAKMAGENLKVKNVTPIKTAEYPLPAPRPTYSVLDKLKYITATGAKVPPWQESLQRYMAERKN